MAALRFKSIEHPSDIGITAYGKNPKEIFENAGFGLFSLIGDLSNVENKERFQVTTGNIVENGHAEEIAEFLGRLNNLDQDALDDLFKKQLREGIVSPKGGAGLGFIDIRRKTGNYLDYSFVKIDKETSFFIFTSTISR